MREENKILVEHKQMLEEQLESSRKRIQTIFSLENELYMVKRELGVAQMEMESDKKKIEELQEVNLFCLFISFPLDIRIVFFYFVKSLIKFETQSTLVPLKL